VVVRDALLLLAVGLASALFPVVNIEAYLAVRAAVGGTGDVWMLALLAAVGQMLGKLVWYRIGASLLDWSWVRRKIEQPRARARLELWRTRTHERPALAGAFVLVSALFGFPPFGILAIVAGQLKMSLVLFVSLGLAGRWLRFAGILGGVAWLDGAGIF
jgi:membrane protein YqaA with SNARE-associated domain